MLLLKINGNIEIYLIGRNLVCSPEGVFFCFFFLYVSLKQISGVALDNIFWTVRGG